MLESNQDDFTVQIHVLHRSRELSGGTYPELASLCHHDAIWRSEESHIVKSPTSLSLGGKRMGLDPEN